MHARMIVVAFAAALFVICGPAGAQERGRSQEREGGPGRERERPGHDLEMQRKQMELNQLKAEFDYQNEMREIELAQKRRALEMPAAAPCPVFCKGGDNWRGPHKMKHCLGFMMICFIVHILLTIWVYQDIRKRNAGSGVWIVITLLTGFFGALLYALVRIGDKSSAA